MRYRPAPGLCSPVHHHFILFLVNLMDHDILDQSNKSLESLSKTSRTYEHTHIRQLTSDGAQHLPHIPSLKALVMDTRSSQGLRHVHNTFRLSRPEKIF